jgi:hypothetical protein
MDRPEREGPKPPASWFTLLLAAGVGIMILAALVMLTGGFLGLVIVVGGGVFALAAFHYLVWGWLIGDKLRREEAEAERQAAELAQRRALLPASSKAAAEPLWIIFWGLLISLLALKINDVEEPFHHAFAFGLIAWGCYRLAGESVHFAVAAALSGILAGWWLLGPFVSLPLPDISRELVFLSALIAALLNCGAVWEMLGGVRDFALARSRPDLAAKAANRRILYAAVMVGCLLAAKLFLYDQETLPVYVAVGGGAIATAVILQLIYRVQAELT